MKRGYFFILMGLIILPLVCADNALNLKIEKTTINNVIVSELNNPAVFNLKITNLGAGNDFQIFSLIGVDMTPKGTFKILTGETKNIEVKVYVFETLRKKPGILTFVYNIHDPNIGSQEDTLTINIMPIQDALEIGSQPITPNSSSAIIFIHNKVNSDFDIEADFSSAFFSASKQFHLEPLEKKELEVSLDREKMKTLVAGQYILTSDFLIQGQEHRVTGNIIFAEQEGILTEESKSGIFFRTHEIKKTNEGNIPTVAVINIKKNIISRLFTTFNAQPSQVTRKGVYVYYVFQQEIKPAESFKIRSRTSWLYPIILLILVLIITYIMYIYTVRDVILKKRVAFVRTKSGDFALRIYLTVKARRYVEKVEINDKLPALVKIHEKFSTPPQKIDHKRHRIGWSIESLQPQEERVFNYIVYSKVAVVGKFELPPATALYEREGKIKESFSNRTSFLNEPLKKGKIEP